MNVWKVVGFHGQIMDNKAPLRVVEFPKCEQKRSYYSITMPSKKKAAVPPAVAAAAEKVSEVSVAKDGADDVGAGPCSIAQPDSTELDMAQAHFAVQPRYPTTPLRDLPPHYRAIHLHQRIPPHPLDHLDRLSTLHTRQSSSYSRNSLQSRHPGH
jgi:hypothetical protein